MKLKMYTDGGARGNPGPAAVGVLILSENGTPLVEHAEAIGNATNNVAEYTALLIGMSEAKSCLAKHGKKPKDSGLDCVLDSELVVKQLNGEYKIKKYDLQKLSDEVRKAALDFRAVSYTHERREADGLVRADQLVNRALDNQQRRSSESQTARNK